MYKCLLAYFYDGYYLIDEDTGEEHGPFEIDYSDENWLKLRKTTEDTNWEISLYNKYVYKENWEIRGVKK